MTPSVLPYMTHSLAVLAGEKPRAGSDTLLAETAAPVEQEKAAKAAEFDSKVRSGLEEIEPPAEGVDVQVADPPTPKAAKVAPVSSLSMQSPCSSDVLRMLYSLQIVSCLASWIASCSSLGCGLQTVWMLQAQVVDTPFSRTSPNYGTRASLAGAATRPPKTGLPPDRPSTDLSKTRSSGLITTGSDEFDAYIDQEAQAARKGPKGSPPGALPPSTALPPPARDVPLPEIQLAR